MTNEYVIIQMYEDYTRSVNYVKANNIKEAKDIAYNSMLCSAATNVVIAKVEDYIYNF